MRFTLLSCLIFAFFPLLLTNLYGEEPGEKIKRPSRESYREYDEVWGLQEGQMPKDINGQFIRITVAPATLPDPLLQYRLNIMPTEQESGNAAPLYKEALAAFNEVYHRRMENLYQSEEFKKLSPEADREAIRKLRFRTFPLYPHWPPDMYTEITAEEESQLYKSLDRVYKLMEKASRKRYYDWSETYEFKGLATLLPDIQDARTLARYLQGKADWEIRNGKYDDAVKSIRICLMLGMHIENSIPHPCLVTGLVGNAIIGVAQTQILNLSVQPDAPNLYPALTQIMLSSDDYLLNAMYGERLWLFQRPVPADIFETINLATADECKTVLDDLVTTFLVGCDAAMSSTISPENVYFETPSGRSVLTTAACLLAYPQAKERLLKQGMTKESIDSLSPYQVVVPYLLGEIRRAQDKMVVITSFPNGASYTAIPYDEQTEACEYSEPVKTLLAIFLPATQAAKSAFARQQQTLDRQKIVEAVRYCAAVRDGRLPASLDDIKELPVSKTDPMTGKPYGYRAEGNKVILDYQTPAPSRMEITIE